MLKRVKGEPFLENVNKVNVSTPRRKKTKVIERKLDFVPFKLSFDTLEDLRETKGEP